MPIDSQVHLLIIAKAEECIRGLKSSQKVIFILTEELFTEEWKIYALDVALNEHRKIILIKLQDVNFEELFGKRFKIRFFDNF